MPVDKLCTESLVMPYTVSKARFSRLVEQALEELPESIYERLEEMPIEIQDEPTSAQLDSAHVAEGNLLLGLYRGRPRTVRSVEDSGTLPDVVYIFQKPIESICHDEDSLRQQIRVTVLHEIGHHYGLSENDLQRLGYS
jgi:predicted Zn-dependent protease with MMP-like domain